MMPYLLILAMTVMGSVASLFLKKASGKMEGDNLFGVMINLLKTPSLYVGGMLYVLGAVLNIYVLRFLDYSTVLPLSAFTYIWTMLLAKFMFGEKITVKKAMGILLIVAGALLVSR